MSTGNGEEYSNITILRRENYWVAVEVKSTEIVIVDGEENFTEPKFLKKVTNPRYETETENVMVY